MAKIKKTRTLTLSDEVFTGLKTLALIKGTSVSMIVESLGRQYISENAAPLQEYFKHQINLFEREKVVAQEEQFKG